jgi:hypothetical protein
MSNKDQKPQGKEGKKDTFSVDKPSAKPPKKK